MSEKKESTGLAAAVHGTVVTSGEMEAAGLMMPIADPASLRAAFAERQRILTSVLDPNYDFLYTVRYFDREGKPRQVICQTLDEAKKQAAHLSATFTAHPKKSGVIKLAHALGIESRQVEVNGLPKDPKAKYSAVRYIARHRRTGREEEGQGYCDFEEKSNMKAHAVISMADTRAYCHAVLRCAGYDNVGAEALDAGGVNDDDVAVTIRTTIPTAEHQALPAQTRPPVMTDVLASAPPAAKPEPTPAPVTPEPKPEPAAAREPLPPVPPSDAAPRGGVITNAMAAELSEMMVAKLGSKPKAREWLVTNAGVERSIHVREDQIGDLKKKLEAMGVP